MSETIAAWNRAYFDGALSDAACELLAAALDAPRPAVEFVERVLARMKASGLRGQDVSSLLAWEVGFILPRILPTAWGGMVPPITARSRHVKLEDYLAANPWHAVPAGASLLDVGCGFPPLTAVDLAERFPENPVLAADPSFARALVVDERGDYACFSAGGELLYFQPGEIDPARWDDLHRDAEATRRRFAGLLRELEPLLPRRDEGELASVESDGRRLVRNPVLEYERPNLTFVEAGIGSAQPPVPVDAVRCMNVLLYFGRDFRAETLRWAASVLADGGLFLTGMDWARTTHARYCVYQKAGDALAMREFAFSLDNLRPLEMIPFFAFHDDDRELQLLQECTARLRQAPRFLADFEAALDGVLERVDLCRRGEDGALGGLPEGASAGELERRMEAVGDGLDALGFVERAVDALRAAEYDAWRNPVGHVAIALPDPTL